MKQFSEEQLQRFMRNEVNDIQITKQLKARIDQRLDAEERKVYHMKKFSIRRIAIAAAVLCVAISGTVFAASKVTGYGTSVKPGSKYESYADLEKAQKKLGIEFPCVENFSNGYSFRNMNVRYTDKYDEEGNIVGSFKEWSGYYFNEDDNYVFYTVHEIQPEEADYVCTPNDSRSIDGILYEYNRDEYKFYPPEMEVPKEDLEREANDEHFFLSYGSDEVMEEVFQTVVWTIGTTSYGLMTFDESLTMEEIYTMVAEIMETK